MNYSKPISSILVVGAVSLALTADVGAQSRGRGRDSGGRSRGGNVVGRAVPRVHAPSRVYAPSRGYGRNYYYGSRRYISPRVLGYVPYRPYYYGYRPGLTIGFFSGYGYPYGYPYAGYYPYGYRSYYGYGGYGYDPYGYTLPPPGYVSARPGAVYGGVRIQGAPREAQVFVDGYYVGIVDDFDGVFQHVNLEAGAHQIEIRIAGQPPIAFDVNVQPGQTMTLHVQ